LEGVAFGSLRELTLRLPRVQYSLMMQIFGGSVQAPMKAHMLSCRASRSWKRFGYIRMFKDYIANQLTSFSSFFISRVMSTLFFRTFLMAYS